MPKNTVTTNENSQLRLVVIFLAMSVVNAVVLFLANMFSPQNVVAGTISLTPAWGVGLTAVALALFTIVLYPLIGLYQKSRGKELTPPEMMVAYFVINFVGLWLITRASDVFGLGVSSFVVVLILAAVLDFLQGMAVMALDKVKL